MSEEIIEQKAIEYLKENKQEFLARYLSAVESRKTTQMIKKLFDDKVVLNIIDKKNNKNYENTSAEKFGIIIPSLR